MFKYCWVINLWDGTDIARQLEFRALETSIIVKIVICLNNERELEVYIEIFRRF